MTDEPTSASTAEQRPWIDVSVPIRPDMPTFEGDPAAHLERVASLAAGDVCNVSRLDIGVHSGTHVDAPVHFVDGAAGVEGVPLDALVGPATVVDARWAEGDLDAAAVGRLEIPAPAERVLLLTTNSALWNAPTFQTTFVGLTGDGASALVQRGIRLVGVDYLSIAPFGNPTPTHRVLLEAGVVVLEGLDLREVEPGSYDLICLPLLIPGSDGGPARAVLRRTAPGRDAEAGRDLAQRQAVATAQLETPVSAAHADRAPAELAIRRLDASARPTPEVAPVTRTYCRTGSPVTGDSAPQIPSSSIDARSSSAPR